MRSEGSQHPSDYWRSVCGCRAGAVFFLAAVGYQIAGYARSHGPPLQAVLRGAGWSIAAGVLGKVLAVLFARAMVIAEIAWAQRRMRRDRREGRVVT